MSGRCHFPVKEMSARVRLAIRTEFGETTSSALKPPPNDKGGYYTWWVNETGGTDGLETPTRPAVFKWQPGHLNNDPA